MDDSIVEMWSSQCQGEKAREDIDRVSVLVDEALQKQHEKLKARASGCTCHASNRALFGISSEVPGIKAT